MDSENAFSLQKRVFGRFIARVRAFLTGDIATKIFPVLPRHKNYSGNQLPVYNPSNSPLIDSARSILCSSAFSF